MISDLQMSPELLFKAKKVLNSKDPPPYPRYACIGNMVVRIKDPQSQPEYLDADDEWQLLVVEGEPVGAAEIIAPARS